MPTHFSQVHEQMGQPDGVEQSYQALKNLVLATAGTSAPEDDHVVPPVPETLADTGIAESIVEQLILKYCYYRGELVGRDLAALLGLQFSLIDEMLETLKRQQKVGVKTSLAEALFNVDTAPIFMPYAIECQGNIIQVYDPVYHQKIEREQSILSALSDDMGYDHRWFRCKRPFIVTGGELALDMLDLSY